MKRNSNLKYSLNWFILTWIYHLSNSSTQCSSTIMKIEWIITQSPERFLWSMLGICHSHSHEISHLILTESLWSKCWYYFWVFHEGTWRDRENPSGPQTWWCARGHAAPGRVSSGAAPQWRAVRVGHDGWVSVRSRLGPRLGPHVLFSLQLAFRLPPLPSGCTPLPPASGTVRNQCPSVAFWHDSRGGMPRSGPTDPL